MKKLLSILLILALLLPAAVVAEESIVNMTSSFYDGYVFVVNGEKKYGLANAAGEITVPCIYDSVSLQIEDGVLLVQLNDLCGYVDAATGEVIVPCEYPQAWPFSEGIGIAQTEDGVYRCFNNKGEVVLEKDFVINPFSEGLAVVDSGSNYTLPWTNAFMNPSGEIVLTFPAKTASGASSNTYLQLSSFHDGMAVAVKAVARYVYAYGYVNKQGEEVVPCVYDYAYDFVQGFARVSSDDLYGFINTKGEEIVPLQYAHAYDFSNGMALVVDENNLAGYVNEQGKLVIPCQFKKSASFHNGFAAVMIDGMVGFIDKTGEIVIEPQYESAGSFSQNYCSVRLNGKWGVIDRAGNVVVEPEYDLIAVGDEGMLGVKDARLCVLTPN